VWNRRSGLLYWIYVWFPVVLGIGVIVLESTEGMGSDHTSHPLRMLFEWIFGHFSNAQWEVIHRYVRKSGHFSVMDLSAWPGCAPGGSRSRTHASSPTRSWRCWARLGGQLRRVAPDISSQSNRISLGRAAGLHRSDCAADNDVHRYAHLPAQKLARAA